MTRLVPVGVPAYAGTAAPFGVPTAPPRAAAARPVLAPNRVEVYSYDARKGIDLLAQATGTVASRDDVVRTAYENAVKVDEYYRTTFGRNSFDDRGSTIKLRVHAPDLDGSTPANNAFWFNDEKRMWFGDGDGSLFGPLGNALDVVAHEFTHAVVDAELKLEVDGQEGALHESFADVLASGIDGNFQIGEGAYTPNVPGDALREMENPTWNNAKTLPPWVTESHELSGIPSLAAVKVSQRVGRERMLKIWYKALTDHLGNHSGFAGAARATVRAAEELYGRRSAETAAVRDAWDAVGVDDRTPKARELSIGEQFSMSRLPALTIDKGRPSLLSARR